MTGAIVATGLLAAGYAGIVVLPRRSVGRAPGRRARRWLAAVA